MFITAERVKRGKPEPDAFLLGAEMLGFAPAECVVVEDAAAGVLAGLNAGSHVIAVNVPAGSHAGRGGLCDSFPDGAGGVKSARRSCNRLAKM